LWAVAEQVVVQVVEHPAVQMEKVKQDIQVEKAVTLDQTHIQDQAEVVEEPL
jgi:hypothetical protein